MKRLLTSFSMVFVLSGCSTFKAPSPIAKAETTNDRLQLCVAFCYFSGKSGYEGKSIITDGLPSNAWKEIQRQCKVLNRNQEAYHLLKSLETIENPGENHITATVENSCGEYKKVQD